MDQVKDLPWSPSPLAIRRPRASHQYEVWSPKLSRRLTFYRSQVRDLWVLLEGDPSVINFCERPIQFQGLRRHRTIDFWIQRSDRCFFSCVVNHSETDTFRQDLSADSGFIEWRDQRQLAVEIVEAESLTQHRVKIDNWRKIVLYLLPSMAASPEICDITRSVCSGAQGATLGALESNAPFADPINVRRAVFTLLAAGVLVAPDLDSVPIGKSTRFFMRAASHDNQ